MQYTLNKDIVLRPESFGLIILRKGSSKVFFVNKTGAFILNQIAKEKNESLAELVGKEFGKKPKKKIKEDIASFLVLLNKNNIISET